MYVTRVGHLSLLRRQASAQQGATIKLATNRWRPDLARDSAKGSSTTDAFCNRLQVTGYQPQGLGTQM